MWTVPHRGLLRHRRERVHDPGKQPFQHHTLPSAMPPKGGTKAKPKPKGRPPARLGKAKEPAEGATNGEPPPPPPTAASSDVAATIASIPLPSQETLTSLKANDQSLFLDDES